MNIKRHLFKIFLCTNKIKLFRYALNLIIKSKTNRDRLEDQSFLINEISKMLSF